MKTGKEITEIKYSQVIDDRKKYIGEQVRKARKRKGYTITRVAEICNRNRGCISNVEEGKGAYTIDTLTLIVECLEIDFLLMKR